MTPGLATLAAEVTRDLQRLLLPPANWTAPPPGPDGAPLLDVLVVGAGMYGLAAAAALSFKGLRNLRVIDRVPPGQEGPWVTTARMRTLRSPKHLPGIALGLPGLTFRAWYEARYGAEAWAELYKISNADWQAYLGFIRMALVLPVENGVALQALAPHEGFVTARLAGPAGDSVIHARRVVLAPGRDGTGGPVIPPGIDPALWPDRAAHTGEAVDLARLRGRRVAVIGAGASAWDAAAAVLEAGAAACDMYIRRAVLPQVNKGRGSANPGFFEGWAALPPAEKWRLLAYQYDVQSPPPHESIARALACTGFRAHPGTPVLAASPAGAGVRLRLPAGEAVADFLILGTGYAVDLAAMPPLAPLAPGIATWADMYSPPPAWARPALGSFPWLAEDFGLVAKPGTQTPGLGRIHLFGHAAFASMGAIASDIPGAAVGAERLAHRLAAAFFVEDIAAIRAKLEAFAEPELEGTPFFDRAAFG
jgi:cation diffusion facilitator CzcD-associated flavoprotein CzcO